MSTNLGGSRKKFRVLSNERQEAPMFRKAAMSLACIASIATGCASTQFASTAVEAGGDVGPGEVRIERGRPNVIVDRVGWLVGTPMKLALWDRRADNHDISPETEEQLVRYLNDNNLKSSLVRVNQYDPLGEWRRLTRNRSVAAPWRYTIGTVDMIKYTLLPGRILGGDWYNPFTDTINIYSDLPPLALAQAAYAKDVHRRKHPGTYAALQELPIVGMWHETIATKDVLDYVKASSSTDEQQEAERILYPNYGASWGGQVASIVPYGNVLGRLAGAGVGHVARVTKERGHRTDADPMTAR